MHVPPVAGQEPPQEILPEQQPLDLRAGLPTGAHSHWSPAVLSVSEQHSAGSVCWLPLVSQKHVWPKMALPPYVPEQQSILG